MKKAYGKTFLRIYGRGSDDLILENVRSETIKAKN